MNRRSDPLTGPAACPDDTGMEQAETLSRWQNSPTATRSEVADLIAECGLLTPENLSRGMVVTGTVAETIARFTGPIALDPSSFTELDDVADAFAKLDDRIEADEVRVKLWIDGAGFGLPILNNGDSTFSFEREWVVAGDFTATAELDDCTDCVVVTLTGRF